MMSAILDTLFILGGSAKLCCCFCCFACRRWAPGPPNPVPAPRTFPDCTNDRALGTVLQRASSLQASPKPPLPAPLSAHALSHKEAAPDKKGEQPAKKERSALSGSLSRASSGAEPPRPHQLSPRAQRPLPRALALGPCSPPRWCRGGWWAPPLRSWARPSWPPSGPEPSWTSPSPWRGLGRPRRRLRARARAAGSWLRLQPPRQGSERGSAATGDKQLRSDRGGYCCRVTEASQLPGEGGDGSLGPPPPKAGPEAGKPGGGHRGRGRRRAGRGRAGRPDVQMCWGVWPWVEGGIRLGRKGSFCVRAWVLQFWIRFQSVCHWAQGCSFGAKAGELSWVRRGQWINLWQQQPTIPCLVSTRNRKAVEFGGVYTSIFSLYYGTGSVEQRNVEFALSKWSDYFIFPDLTQGRYSTQTCLFFSTLHPTSPPPLTPRPPPSQGQWLPCLVPEQFGGRLLADLCFIHLRFRKQNVPYLCRLGQNPHAHKADLWFIFDDESFVAFCKI